MEGSAGARASSRRRRPPAITNPAFELLCDTPEAKRRPSSGKRRRGAKDQGDQPARRRKSYSTATRGRGKSGQVAEHNNAPILGDAGPSGQSSSTRSLQGARPLDANALADFAKMQLCSNDSGAPSTDCAKAQLCSNESGVVSVAGGEGKAGQMQSRRPACLAQSKPCPEMETVGKLDPGLLGKCLAGPMVEPPVDQAPGKADGTQHADLPACGETPAPAAGAGRADVQGPNTEEKDSHPEAACMPQIETPAVRRAMGAAGMAFTTGSGLSESPYGSDFLAKIDSLERRALRRHSMASGEGDDTAACALAYPARDSPNPHSGDKCAGAGPLAAWSGLPASEAGNCVGSESAAQVAIRQGPHGVPLTHAQMIAEMLASSQKSDCGVSGLDVGSAGDVAEAKTSLMKMSSTPGKPPREHRTKSGTGSRVVSSPVFTVGQSPAKFAAIPLSNKQRRISRSGANCHAPHPAVHSALSSPSNGAIGTHLELQRKTPASGGVGGLGEETPEDQQLCQVGTLPKGGRSTTGQRLEPRSSPQTADFLASIERQMGRVDNMTQKHKSIGLCLGESMDTVECQLPGIPGSAAQCSAVMQCTLQCSAAQTAGACERPPQSMAVPPASPFAQGQDQGRSHGQTQDHNWRSTVGFVSAFDLRSSFPENIPPGYDAGAGPRQIGGHGIQGALETPVIVDRIVATTSGSGGCRNGSACASTGLSTSIGVETALRSWRHIPGGAGQVMHNHRPHAPLSSADRSEDMDASALHGSCKAGRQPGQPENAQMDAKRFHAVGQGLQAANKPQSGHAENVLNKLHSTVGEEEGPNMASWGRSGRPESSIVEMHPIAAKEEERQAAVGQSDVSVPVLGVGGKLSGCRGLPDGGGSSVPGGCSAVGAANRRLEAYLPEVLCSAFRQSGINKDLYDWQAECLCRPGVLDGKNLVYCAPTSGGKSLVAEILMMRQVIATGKACLLVLPFVSLCGEKAAHLERLLAPMHKTVRGFYGSQGGGEIFRNDTGALVCTIEKANMLVCRMIEEQLLDRLCVVVVDELHMVAEDDRGYLLELLLTKLRYATFVNDQESEVPRSEGLQVIGMSATMPNGADVARWLGAELYVTDFRPVPLKRMLLIGRALKDPQMKTVGEVPVDPEWERSDPEHYAWLAKETVDEGHSVLLFCATKKACSDAAKIIAKMVTVPERKIECAANPGQHDRAWIVGELRRLSGSAEAILANVIAKGVAFHHAGLSSEERELVEMAYRCGAISVLAATSTLAAGVNLPARRVIFRHPYMYKDKKKVLLDGTKYRQMSGRAGRAGIDTHGEAILLNSADFSSANMVKLLQEDPKPISSCLSEDRRGMKRAMNEVVASGAVSTPVDVDRFVKCTLLAATSDFQDVVADATKKALHWLGVKQFVRWEGNAYFAPTALGKASLASSLAPDDAIIVKEDLARARQCFVMTTELHLTFLVTPLSELPYINWQALFRLYKSLPECEKKVAELVGANEGYIQKMSHNPPNNSSKDGVVSEPERICERFYAALILHDLIQEVPIDAICEKYEILQGGVQSLQTNSGKFAGMVALFCERLGWLDLEALVAKFQGRVWSGVKPEILALTEIPYVKAARARTLYKAGLRTVDQVAAVESVNSLVAILANGAPHGGIKGDNNDAQLAIERRAAKMILKGARELLVQKAQELKDQAAAAEVIVNQRKRERSMSGSLAVAAKSPSEDPLQAMAEPNAMTPPPSPPPSAQAHKLRLAVESSTGIVTVSDPDDIRHACSFLATLPQFSFDFDATQPPVGAPGPSLELPPGPLGPESDNNQNPQGKPNPHANPNLHLAHTVNGVAFSWTDEHAIYINLRNNENCSQWQFVADVMKGPAEKVAFRLKSQLKAVGAVGESEKRCMNVVAAVDVGIAAWLLQPDEASGFRGCGSGRGSFPTTLEKMLEVHGGRSAVMQACACLNGAKCVGRPAAACKRASMSRKLFGFLAPQLQTQGLLTPLHDVEMPLVPVLVAMEATGMPFDPRICASQRGSLQRRLTELEEKAHRDAGRVFNLTSAQEVAGVLFEDLGLVPPPSAQQGKRGLSTKAEVLQELALEHPLPGLILEHRKLKKLITGFVDSLTGCVCRAGEGASGTEPPRLHGTFLQTSTATGRLSMDEPNLQTVPHPVDYETTASETPPDVLPTGDQPRSSYCFNVRAAFRAPEGWLMLSADYCQLEFRLMAHFSGDESLQQMFRDPGGDPFRLLAAQWLDTPMDEVTEQQRTHAKRLAYGLLYGMGPQALADDLQIPVPAAAQMADAFRASLPGVDAWLRRVVEDCRRTGFVQTIGGRRRYLPDVAERNGGKRGRAERQAVNTLCQGSAADLVKVAMARVHRRIRVEAAGTCHMLLQVHDELLFEVREGALSAVVLLIRAGMERDNGLSVPTPVRLSAGPSWGQLRRL